MYSNKIFSPFIIKGVQIQITTNHHSYINCIKIKGHKMPCVGGSQGKWALAHTIACVCQAAVANSTNWWA